MIIFLNAIPCIIIHTKTYIHIKSSDLWNDLSITFISLGANFFSIFWTQFSVAYSITDNFTKIANTITIYASHKMRMQLFKIYRIKVDVLKNFGEIAVKLR